MTKERFESVSEFTDLEIYEFYLLHCKGNCISLDNFMSIINNVILRRGPFKTEPVFFQKDVAFKKMIEYYKNKFA